MNILLQKKKWTLLHFAAFCGDEKVGKYLTRKGANVYLTDNMNMIPRVVARMFGNDKIGALLEKKELENTISY